MSNSRLIPNTFQHPNAYVDWLSYYLTPEEEKVLNKAIREILGWDDKIADRQAHIALSIFEDGKFKDGQRVCFGCGLSKDAIRKALKALHEFGVLLKIGKATQDGQLYRLNDDWDTIKHDALRVRREAWDSANKKRTKKARRAQGVMSDSTQGVVSDSTQGVMSDSNKETQVETQKETKSASPRPKKKPFSPLLDENYAVKEYYKDVDVVGTREKGPWQMKCPSCGVNVLIDAKDTPVSCGCGMHDLIVLGKRPPADTKMHPAIQVLRRKIGNRKINDEQRKIIEQDVGTSQGDLDFWRQVIEGWLQHGWYEGNVAGMLGWYNRREIPHTGKRKQGQVVNGMAGYVPVERPPA